MHKLRKLFNPTVLWGMGTVAVLGLLLLGHKNFSMDELDSIFITKNWSTLLQVIHYREGNMWLYYVLLYLWERLVGTGEAAVRALSVIFAVAVVPVVYALGRRLFDARVARLATLMLAVNTFLIFNAQNARAYTLVLFLTTLASHFVARYAQEGKGRYLAGAGALNVLAVYSHLYALFVVVAQFVALAVAPDRSGRPRWRRWSRALPAFAVTGLLALPLLLAPSFHAQPVSWIPAPEPRNLVGTFAVLSGDFLPGAAVCAGLLGWLAVSLWRRGVLRRWTPEAWNYAYLGVWIVVPVVIALAYSLAVKPIYTSPYFFVCLVPFALLVAAGLAAVRRTWLRRGLLGLVVVLSLVRLGGWYAGVDRMQLVLPNNNEDWAKTAKYLAARVRPGDAVVYYPSMEADKVDYYRDRAGLAPVGHEVVVQPYFLTTGVNTAPDQAQVTGLSGHYRRVWFVVERVYGADAVDETATIERYLRAHYSVKQVERLEWLEVYDYEQ